MRIQRHCVKIYAGMVKWPFVDTDNIIKDMA